MAAETCSVPEERETGKDWNDTNSNGLANFIKHYNTIEFQAKYSNFLWSHKFYLFYLTRFNSCHNKLYYTPQFNSRALISQLSHEIDFSLELNKNAVFVLSYGIERVVGNEFTDIGDANNPKVNKTIFYAQHPTVEFKANYTSNQTDLAATILNFLEILMSLLYFKLLVSLHHPIDNLIIFVFSFVVGFFNLSFR